MSIGYKFGRVWFMMVFTSQIKWSISLFYQRYLIGFQEAGRFSKLFKITLYCWFRAGTSFCSAFQNFRNYVNTA
jgi:hypothetical protein